ncbi:MAG: hypothetical protein WCI12_10375, partial [Actinomycetes bacterium]
MSRPVPPSLRKRIQWWGRWARGRLDQGIGRQRFYDPHRDPSRSLYVASWQRSGSTWLAEMVASAPKTRLIYEPANVRQRLYLDGEPRLAELPLSGPDDDLGADGIALQRAASG